MKDTPTEDLAACIIWNAFFSLTPTGSSSRIVAIASDSTVWYPSSRSFWAVAGPTPGRSSMNSYFVVVSVSCCSSVSVDINFTLCNCCIVKYLKQSSGRRFMLVGNVC